jgi:uncharacterized damage-inducible protein DinB
MTDANPIGEAVIAEVRRNFRQSMAKMEHCLTQLSDEQLWWRPREEMNSIANLLLHLAGNLRQWLLAGVGGKPDVRNRPAEFTDRSRRSKQQVANILRETLAEVDALLERLTPQQLLEKRRIQGYDETVLGALLHTVTHFQGHVQEIIHMTRAQLGDTYRVEFVPQNEEQRSAKGPAL